MSKITSRGESLSCYCEAYLNNSNVTLSSKLLVLLDTFVINRGGFSITDNGIKVPKDGVVSVSASAMLSPYTGYAGLTINVNSTPKADYYQSPGSKTYGCLELANRLVTVKAGDIIYLYAQSSVTTDIVVNNSRTRLTIQYLD